MTVPQGGFDPYHAWLGIAPHERPISYYRLLGLQPFESDPQVIEAAVDQRLAFLRTKTTGPHASYAEQLINQIVQARLTLLDPVRKQAYDAALPQQFGPMSAGSSGAGFPANEPVSLPLGHSFYRSFRKKKQLSQQSLAVLMGLGVALVCAVGLIIWMALTPRKEQGPLAQRSRLPHQAAAHAPEEQKDHAAPQEPAKPRQGAEGQVDRKRIPVPQRIGRQEPGVQQQAPFDRRDQQGVDNAIPAKPDGDEQLVPAQAGKLPWLKKVHAATVLVEGEFGLGSGFFVQTPRGKKYVVTNAHVILDNGDIRVKLSTGEQIRVTMGQLLPEYDLAILDIRGVNLPDALELREDLPEVGERVFAYGAPRGLQNSLTEGIVSAVRTTEEIRQVVADGSFDKLVRKAEARWIQTTAPVSPGNSGGPLVDEQGRVVGMNTAGFSARLAQNLNFALASPEIKSRLVKPVLAMLSVFPPAGRNDPQRLLGGPAGFAPARPGLPADFGPMQPGGNRNLFDLYPFESYSCPDVVLPSGAVFQAGKIRPPANWRKIIQDAAVIIYRKGDFNINLKVESRIGFYVCYDDNDRMQFAAGFYQGLLEGPLVLFHGGDPYVIANYRQGSREGPFVVLDEQVNPSFFVEFVRGRRQGVVCVFDSDPPYWPRYVETWRANNMVESCYVTWNGEKPTVRLVAAVTEAEEHARVRQYAALVVDELGKIEELEKAIRAEVVEVFREFDRAIKRGRAADFAVDARARIVARHAAREVAGAAVRAEANARLKSEIGPPRP
ncbi:S1C family serine protease [Thermogutta sp.]|uniref:S1C family serine protease n=1 Tax=Thermogutta sp. TaxID=1962930 RepID=UPI00322023B4